MRFCTPELAQILQQSPYLQKESPVVSKLKKGMNLINVVSKQKMHSSPLPYDDFLER